MYSFIIKANNNRFFTKRIQYMKKLTILIFLLLPVVGFNQNFIIKNIHSFGAKGDGKTNDHDAFVKAANYFNNRGGNGKLIIPKGTYIVGKQEYYAGKNGKPAYLGVDLLHFKNVNNLSVEGK